MILQDNYDHIERLLEADVHCPKKLHKFHNDLPSLIGKIKIRFLEMF